MNGNKKKLNIFFEYKHKLALSLAVLIFLVKIAGDLLFFLTGFTEEISAILFKIITSSAIISFLLYYFFLSKHKSDRSEDFSFEIYTSELIRIIIAALILLVCIAFLPGKIKNLGNSQTMLSVVFIDFVTFYGLFVGFHLMVFVKKWLWLYRHKHTKSHFRIFQLSLYLILILEIPHHFHPMVFDKLNKYYILSYFLLALQVTIFVLMFLTTSKNSWIAVLPKGHKWRLILMTAAAAAISVIITVKTVSRSGDNSLFNVFLSFFGSSSFISFPFGISIAYFLRIILSSLASLPTTDILVRKNNELSSLTYLNRMITGKFDSDNLFETVTTLAFNATRATSAWMEFNSAELTFSVKSAIFIKQPVISDIYRNSDLHSLSATCSEPILIDSLKEYRDYDLSYLFKSGIASSLILIPLFTGGKPIGSIFLLHQQEYGFDTSYINLLAAFRDNVNLALENSRLIEESIEKEKYKKELILAKDIQQKLLPVRLPELENYKISAFNLPAEEVGGDYYDIVILKNGNLCLLIGDVSGKGMSAAFYMALLKGVVLSAAKESNGAADLLNKINSTLFGAMEKKMFITMAAVSVNDTKGSISIARAGHTPVFVVRNNTVETLTTSGIGIGLTGSSLFEEKLEEKTIQLSRNDSIILFTDGVLDLKELTGDETGLDSLKQIIKNSVYANEGYMLDEIKVKLDEFRCSCEQCDDTTLLALSFIGKLE